MAKRYRFEAIFKHDPQNETITPKFNVVINGVPFRKGTIIYKGISFGGLNLF